ncbi:MAG: hypothetical protein WC780_00555 [Lentimicrobiaceae bacterium]
MDNVIYILIGIAWIAYSLYSARQKAIQKQQSQGMPHWAGGRHNPHRFQYQETKVEVRPCSKIFFGNFLMNPNLFLR